MKEGDLGANQERVELKSGLNVVWAPSLEVEEDYDGRSFNPMTKDQITNTLAAFMAEIQQQGGTIVDALDVNYEEDQPLGGIYGDQKAIRKGRVYIISK